jgi:S-adenosylmethionine decarboxylase
MVSGTRRTAKLRQHQTLGQHTLTDYYGCDPRMLKRTREVKRAMCSAVRHGGGSIVKAVFHNFCPYGVSGVVVITESHVTIHTWPEHQYAAVDIFSCGDKLDHAAIEHKLRRLLGARRIRRRSLKRGVMEPA